MTLFPEDPRSYVRREYEQRFKRNPSYSWRSFARDLKLSPSMLSEFLKGRYGLSRAKASYIAQLIRLDQPNTEHFIDLLEAGFHRLPAQRELARLRATERLAQTHAISAEVISQLMDWTYFAAMEILGIQKGQLPEESGWLKPFRQYAQRAREAVGQLNKLDLLREENGGVVPRDEITIAGEQAREEDTIHLHSQVLDLAQKALKELSSEDRESISAFASVNKDDLPEMRKELNDALMEVLNKYSNRPKADAVICVSLQGFTVYKAEN